MTIVAATAVALAGVVVGAHVQKAARFIYPVDCLTILIAVLILADALLGAMPWEPFWYLPFGLGYATGYLVVGRTSYVMVWETSLATKRVQMRPWVLWEEHGRTYIQEQTQRALLRRLVCRVRHEVVSDVPLDSSWVVEAKYPLFPEFVRPTVVVESVDVSWVPEHWFWRFSVRRYTTRVDVAYAGTVSKMQLAQDEAALRVLQGQNTALVSELRDMRSRQGPALMEMALRMEQSIEATSPVNRMYDLLNAQQDGLKRKRKERRAEKRAQAKEEKEDGGEEDAAAEAQP